ncbi:MAG: hypothetical protein WC212_00415 [Candidatus Delongbacteria bacterium]|jgi:hypothetical protein
MFLPFIPLIGLIFAAGASASAVHTVVSKSKVSEIEDKINIVVNKGKDLINKKKNQIKDSKKKLINEITKTNNTKRIICDELLIPYFKYFNEIANFKNEEYEIRIEDNGINIEISNSRIALRNLHNFKNECTKFKSVGSFDSPLSRDISLNILEDNIISALATFIFPIGGIIASFDSVKKAETKLEEARIEYDKLKIEASRVDTVISIQETIIDNLAHLNKTLKSTQKTFKCYLNNFDYKRNKDYSHFSEDEKKNLMVLHTLAYIQYCLITRKLFGKNNKLTKKARELYDNAKNVISRFSNKT